MLILALMSDVFQQALAEAQGIPVEPPMSPVSAVAFQGERLGAFKKALPGEAPTQVVRDLSMHERRWKTMELQELMRGKRPSDASASASNAVLVLQKATELVQGGAPRDGVLDMLKADKHIHAFVSERLSNRIVAP